MTTFDKREDASENRYMHDQEVEFKVHARRNKIIAIWAAEKMHYDEAHTKLYIQTLLETVLKVNDDDDVINRVFADLQKNSISITQDEVHRQLLLSEKQAREELK